jgi:hypothetical protein
MANAQRTTDDAIIEALVAKMQKKIDAALAARPTATTVEILTAIKERRV